MVLVGTIAGILEALWTRLRGDATLTAILGKPARLYHVWAPPDSPMPYWTYAMTDAPDLEAAGLSSGELLLELWDHDPDSLTAVRAEAAGDRVTKLLDGHEFSSSGGEVKAVRVAQLSKGFLETDSDRVHRWVSRWTLRYVRQGEMQ